MICSEFFKIREIACARLELNLKPSVQRGKKFSEEIFEVRKMIRTHGLLSIAHHGVTPINDGSTLLDQCLQNYVYAGEQNRDSYYNAYLSNEKIHLPVLTTGVEYDGSKEKEEDIKEALQRKLIALKEPFYSIYKKSFKKTMNKDEMIDLLKAVNIQLEHQKDADYESFLSDAFKNYIDLS